MKEYPYTVKIVMDGYGLEANSKKELVEKVKEIFMEEHNIELCDEEITVHE